MITLEELMEAGVHFGHRIPKWNPRMAPYIFGERKGIHIIDLVQSLYYFQEASKFLTDWKKNKTTQSILLVGTKKQASHLVQISAERLCEAGFSAHYVNHRWLGGLLTNWSTMKLCIHQLNTLESREKNGELDLLPKKERAVLKKEYQKLNTYFGGMKKMIERPNLVFILGQDTEVNAVRECAKLRAANSDLSSVFNKLNGALPVQPLNPGPAKLGFAADKAEIKLVQKIETVKTTYPTESRGFTSRAPKPMYSLRTITLLDTNCDPSLSDLFIPGNDDSTKSLELILGKLIDVLVSP